MVALAALAGLVWLVVALCEGHFIYTLDDPYIHLALARGIAHGTYGINPGEVSAPSSSILWPFLLAPFGWLPTQAFEYVPLLINVGCLAASCILLVRLMPASFGVAATLLSAGLLILGLNLVGLVLTGMEHSLQILLVLVILSGLCRESADADPRTQAAWRAAFYIALVLLPLVRYEGMALTVPLLAYRFWQGDRRPVYLSALALCFALGGFSLYLWSQGLGLLPSSVLAKSEPTGGFHPFAALLPQAARFPLLLAGALVLTVLMALRGARGLAAVVLAATVLHFTFGRFGWFGRYEVYWLCFVMVLLVREVARVSSFLAPLVCLLPLGGSHVWISTISSPLVARNIYGQPAQTARIATLLDGKVAINDLGLVALRGGKDVLDLYGLASIEALRLRQASPGNSAWVGPLVARHQVRYLMVFDKWFPELPASLVKVGQMDLATPGGVNASNTVSFYATDAVAAVKMAQAIRRYSACCSTPQAIVRLEPGI